MAEIGAPPPARASALTAIRAATQRFATAAAEIARAGATASDAASVTISADGRRAAERDVDMTSSLVDTMGARSEVAANVAVLRTDDEVSRELLELARRSHDR